MPAADPARRANALLAAALAAGRSARLEVVGSCMRPLLRAGDRVWIERDGPAAAGQVALAWTADGGWVCHRVVARGRKRVALVSDLALEVARVPPARVLGRVVEVERRGRRLRLAGRPALAERLLARLQRLSIRLRGTPAALPLEAARRRLRAGQSLRLWRRARPASPR